MKRISWRGIFCDRSVQRIVKSGRIRGRGNLNIYSRRSSILPAFIGRVVLIHTGRKLVHIRIHKWMVNHKFGEFAFTKKLGPSIHDSIRNRKRRAKMKVKK